MKLNHAVLIKATGFLIVSTLVFLLYRFYVEPASLRIAEAKLLGEMAKDRVTLAEVLKGAEQAVCLVLFFWVVFFILLEQFTVARRERAILTADPVPAEEVSIRRQDAMAYLRSLETLPEADQTTLLPRVLRRAFSRFHAGHSVEDVSRSVTAVCEDELARLEAQSSAVRYVAWAIPSIGFVGTVRGIGLGLGLASDALKEQDITPVTAALGLAFNSTLVSLLLSLVLMLLIHWLQSLQEEAVQGVTDYCEAHCIDRLEVAENA